MKCLFRASNCNTMTLQSLLKLKDINLKYVNI